MSENNSAQKKDSVCKNSGLETFICECQDCTGFNLDAAQLIAGNDIKEILEKIDKARWIFDYLLENSFEVQYDYEYNFFSFIPPPVADGNYWVRCPGCFIPILLSPEDPPQGMCLLCAELIESRSEDVKYYGDLFEYISVMFELKRNLTESLSYTHEFCEIHDLDYEAVKKRLNNTGGYDEGEVMMNSTESIPLFEKMPVKK
ncbi:MAG: hypothetical protein ACTSV2_03600 [Candidatus Thorarchaeota archaeon]